MEMNCNQCQEAAKGIGCTYSGVCGKSPELSALMDTFIYSLIGLSSLAVKAKKLEINTEEIDLFVIEGLFATITMQTLMKKNLSHVFKQSINYREQYKALLQEKESSYHQQLFMN